jgi:hypothetical protein
MTPTPTAEKQAVQQASAQLRGERRQVRAQRRLEDAAWQATRAGHQAEQAAVQTLSTEDRRQQRHTRRAAAAQWRALRAQRRATLAQRAQEDADWRAQRQHLRERQAHLPVVTAWIAVLVVLDNCNRQCWGLPLFVTGAHVTAEVIVAALAETIAARVAVLDLGPGVHFKAQTFHDFLHSRAVSHVLIARQSPAVQWHCRTLCAHAQRMAGGQSLARGTGVSAALPPTIPVWSTTTARIKACHPRFVAQCLAERIAVI